MISNKKQEGIKLVDKVKGMQLRTEVRETYNHFTDEMSKEHLLCLSTEQLRTGLIASMFSETDGDSSSQSSRNFAVLLVIAAHMDADGKSFPSQKRIAELTGLTRFTVAKAVKALSEIKVGGKPILQVKKVPNKKGHEKTVYYFNSNNVEMQDSEETGIQEPQKPTDTLTSKVTEPQIKQKSLNSRDLLHLFITEYEKAFGITYVPNYGKDMSLLKNKLIGKFTNEDLAAGITVAVSRYSDEWANSRYQYPTVSMLCTWLFNEAIKIVKEEQKQEQQIAQRMSEAQQYTEDNILNLLG